MIGIILGVVGLIRKEPKKKLAIFGISLVILVQLYVLMRIIQDDALHPYYYPGVENTAYPHRSLLNRL